MNIFDSYIDAGQAMTREDREKYYTAILEYLAYGIEPEAEGTALAVITAIRPSLDESRNKRVAGLKSAEVRKTKADTTNEQNRKNQMNRTPKIEGTKPQKSNEQNSDSAMNRTPKIEGTKSKGNSNKKEGIPNGIPKKEKSCSKNHKPTVEEVAAYVAEHNYAYVDPETFVSYYASQGWKKANGQALSDWKIACSGWNSRARNRGEPEVRSTASRAPMPDKYAAFSGEVTS